MKKECGEQDPAFQALQQEFKDLIQNCSEEERAILMDRFDKVVDGYTKMEDLIGERENLCQQWSRYSDAHKAAQAKLKNLQARLAAPDIKEEEVRWTNLHTNLSACVHFCLYIAYAWLYCVCVNWNVECVHGVFLDYYNHNI